MPTKWAPSPPPSPVPLEVLQVPLGVLRPPWHGMNVLDICNVTSSGLSCPKQTVMLSSLNASVDTSAAQGSMRLPGSTRRHVDSTSRRGFLEHDISTSQLLVLVGE